MSSREFYMGNPNLKRSGVTLNWSPENIQEFIKCKDDPVYFITQYVKIVHIDRGLVDFDL